MKKLALIFTCLAFFISCTHGQEQFNNEEINTNLTNQETKIDSAQCGLNFIPNQSYKNQKTKINTLRNKLSAQYKLLNDSSKKAFINSVKLVFANALLNDIIPHWYGTEWDFNGYTAKPNEGKIACGYFVSTTLRDLGFNLNRYDLAKKGPEDEAKSVAISQQYTSKSKESEIKEKLNSLKDGVYFIGLDNHVGYLYKKDSITYFIHSNYLENKVMIELTATSRAFESSMYYVSEISGNDELIEKWLTNKPIKITGN